MELDIQRKWLTPHNTIGELFINGAFFCHTLEDVIRPYPNKVPKETAIWEGVYKCRLDFSPKYNKPMPHVMNVPLFEGIRIHPGNTEVDTEGCILLGVKSGETIAQSKITFAAFFERFKAAADSGEEINLMIHNPIEKLKPLDG